MAICKFFLQGTCRFGDTCKFEHQINDSSYGGGTSILHQNYHANSPKPQTTSNIDTNTLVKAVVNDMTSAEKGGQWILSSYAPYKEKPAFPGFEDHSMEEIRYLFYEAMKNGTGEQYKQHLQMMLQQALMKIKSLQNPSPEAVSMLKNIYDTPPSSGSNNQNTPPAFGANSGTNSMFGAPPPQKSMFGSASPNQSIFGGGNTQPQTAFNSPSPSSIFGGQPSGIFAAPPNAQQSQAIFARQPPAAAGGSIFGAPPSYASVAPQAQPMFTQQPPQNSVFAQPSPQAFAQAAPQPQNVFQQTANVSPFAAQTSTPFNPSGGPFGAAQPNFGVTPEAAAAASPSSNTPQFQHSQSIFGTLGPQPQTANVFGNVPQSAPNGDFYSKMEDLTEEEVRWFQSDDLDMMKIPEKPPTYEMCFKVQR